MTFLHHQTWEGKGRTFLNDTENHNKVNGSRMTSSMSTFFKKSFATWVSASRLQFLIGVKNTRVFLPGYVTDPLLL